MPLKRTLTGGAFAATTLLLAVASSPLTLPAHADLYHAVEPGETLSTIATRYRLSSDTIRVANKLDGTRDNAALPAMLLLIPENTGNATGNAESSVKSAPRAEEKNNLPVLNGITSPTLMASATTVNAPSGNTSELRKSSGSGTIVQLTRYVVQKGDTIQSIAQKFSKPGASVSAAEIRRRNYISNDPAVGTMLLVPVTTVSYNPSESGLLSQATDKTEKATAPIEKTTEAESNGSSENPRVLAQPTPVFQSPIGNTGAAPRGNVLAARGRGDNSVLLVQPGQETSASTMPPSPRARAMQTQQVQAAPQTALAQVAKVARRGGTIRRLPDSEAVTLYRCAVGTDLAVTKRSGTWSAVLMSDRSTGWIPTKYLRFTDIKVDISTQVVTNNGYEGSASGNYSSNHPAVMQALGWLGTRYVYGGTSRRGIDCSALVMKSFAAVGKRLPRTAAQQSRVGAPVDPSSLRPGDRLYFSASGTRVDHTGLYMGDGRFVHASGRGRQVIVSNLFDRAHWNIFVGARR